MDWKNIVVSILQVGIIKEVGRVNDKRLNIDFSFYKKKS